MGIDEDSNDAGARDRPRMDEMRPTISVADAQSLVQSVKPVDDARFSLSLSSLQLSSSQL